MTEQPTLILISGAPGTGKTVLAQRLAEALPVAVIEKDAIKETLFDTLGVPNVEWSKKLGAAAFELLYMIVQSHLKAGQSIVAEAAFWSEHGVQWLDRMEHQYDFRVLELHCHADRETVLRRLAGREASHDRHGGHRSDMSIDALVEQLRNNYQRYGPLTAGNELIRIDTQDFATIDYAAIVSRVSVALGHHQQD